MAACLRVAELSRVAEAADGLFVRSVQRLLRATQAGDRVQQLLLRLAAVAQLFLGGGVEPGVLERDRGKPRETGEEVDLRRAEQPLGLGAGEAEHADDLTSSTQRHADDGVELQLPQLGWGACPRRVVVDDERLAGRRDPPSHSLADAEPVVHPVAEGPGTDMDAEL